MTAERARWLLRAGLIGSALALAVVVNVIGLATIVIDHQRAFDWDNYVEAARRFPLGTLYDWDYPYGYHYAPQLAPVLGLELVGPVARTASERTDRDSTDAAPNRGGSARFRRIRPG